MIKSEEVVVHEFAGVRTGKASTALVENLMIEAYEGSSMRLLELASISTPELRTIIKAGFGFGDVNVCVVFRKWSD